MLQLLSIVIWVNYQSLAKLIYSHRQVTKYLTVLIHPAFPRVNSSGSATEYQSTKELRVQENRKITRLNLACAIVSHTSHLHQNPLQQKANEQLQQLPQKTQFTSLQVC